jgi:hypothetical protein
MPYLSCADIPDRLQPNGQRSACLPCGSAATRPCVAGDSGKGAGRGVAHKTFPKTDAPLAALAAVNLEAIVLYTVSYLG